MNNSFIKTIAVTIGDINGIGPEVTLKALQRVFFANENPDFRVAIIGPFAAIQFWQDHLHLDLSMPLITDLEAWPNGTPITILDNRRAKVEVQIGQLSEAAGKIAGEALAQAIRLAREQKIQAMVTAPVSKLALHLAGFHYPGQTEFLAEGFGVSDYAMMLAAGDFRVTLVTTHLPLREVPAALSQELIVRRLRVLHRDLQNRFHIHSPRIAVTGLNPHAGEGGLLGEEERNIIAPAIQQARQEGIAAEGPFSADALFARVKQNQFDAYLAMYHDQGLVPLKMFGFGRAVNYTAGLPVIRTSPDHGTAFDIAGKGIADPTSMMEALRFAAALLEQC
jgi:4-hydroxythreonine-4-phosphate dehydrogenase